MFATATRCSGDMCSPREDGCVKVQMMETRGRGIWHCSETPVAGNGDPTVYFRTKLVLFSSLTSLFLFPLIAR